MMSDPNAVIPLATSVIPTSPAAAKQALIAMERDLVDAKTYEQIRRIVGFAEVLKKLYADVEDVKRQAEQTIVVGSHRVGEELRAAPVATARGSNQFKERPSQDASPPTLAQQVGSKNRGLRLKQLAETPRQSVVETVQKLQQSGRDATVTSVLKELHGDGKAERRETRVRELVERTVEAAKQLGGAKQYNVILADPPWRFEPYSRDTGMDRAADNHYPTMDLPAIGALDVPAAKDCVLFLWATIPMLPAALHVMASWGFSYKSQFVWVKDKIGTGYWVRERHELLLIGTRGTIPAPAPGEQYDSVITAPRGRHSEKPARVFEMIEEMYPALPRLEMFSRAGSSGVGPVGWDLWGNES